jgi:hypothetical protein
MEKGWGYRWRCPSFGLTPEYQLSLHKQIFELSYHSSGAINIDIAYNLPVHLRNFYYKQLIDLKERENKESTTNSPPKKTARPF